MKYFLTGNISWQLQVGSYKECGDSWPGNNKDYGSVGSKASSFDHEICISHQDEEGRKQYGSREVLYFI